MTTCERYRVSGRVQGVGFRYAALGEARQLGIHGWVRNLPDGSVEALAAGAADKVARFHEWLQHGPPGARVTAVRRETDIDAGDLSSFDIR